MSRTHAGRADFVLVYIREAHAKDEWAMEQNEAAGISVTQPRSGAERTAVARKFVRDLKVSIPTVVDDMDDTVGRAYGAWPERLYVIDPDGTVGYQGGFGPFDFVPAQVADYLERFPGSP